MKHPLRFCLILLLSLALPLAGMAGALPAEPCPMQRAGMAHMTDMAPDCCQDADSAAKHGQPCKPGQECKTSSPLQMATGKPSVAVAGPLAAHPIAAFLPERTPSGVWRPPRV